MNTQVLICYAYLIIGLLVMTYDWHLYQKPIYDQTKQMDMVEDGMAVMYMLGVTLLWPIKLLSYLR